VYARHMPELREIAEPILREVLEEDTEMRWMQGTGQEEGKVEVAPLDKEKVEEWSGGSRAGGRVAGAARTKGVYLEEWATVADAEEEGVMLAWEKCDRVALDS